MGTHEYREISNGDMALVRKSIRRREILATRFQAMFPEEWRRAGEIPHLREEILDLILRPSTDDADRVIDFALRSLVTDNPMSDEQWREWIAPRAESLRRIVRAGMPPTSAGFLRAVIEDIVEPE